jgi:hypothetical protein
MESEPRQLDAQVILIGHRGVDQEFSDRVVALLLHDRVDPASDSGPSICFL